jgi:GntR family transcriptional regulator
MEFNAPKPIFLQICDIIIDRILRNELHGGDRIPSVRDMGEHLAVNPNTIQRAYAELQNKEIIEQQRGIGYFIKQNSKEIALKTRKEEFVQIQLPLLIHQMEILEISWDELKEIQLQLTSLKEST